MKMTARIAIVCSLLTGGVALADDAPDSAKVLAELHQSNLKEIQMGKMAVDHAMSKDVAAFGKTLIADHKAADKKVAKLAKAEKVTLSSVVPRMDHPDQTSTGTGFDDAFAADMLDDHKKDVASALAARDATNDAALKQLLNDLLPVLQKHQDIAQKLVDLRGHRN